MPNLGFTIEDLWETVGFKPNPYQDQAIRHTHGPLYLPAGPGSGKTRVLLWRTLNLIVFHDVPPDAIYLSTFTEKAALQLREGLQALLGEVTNRTGHPYDLTQMYVGTVHSLCQRLITDRRFSSGRQRVRAPQLLDELGQYFHLFKNRTWNALAATAGLGGAAEENNLTIHQVFEANSKYANKHTAVSDCLAFFNRLSEECVDPDRALAQLRDHTPEFAAHCTRYGIAPAGLDLLFRLYGTYRDSLHARPPVTFTDFALLQQAAYEILEAFPGAGHVFHHVIVDEYQDTNTIQERLFFKLAAGHKNICVVGDDDQALYRFRGATVENFVEFPARCEQHLGVTPTTIPLTVNYRSRPAIVAFYQAFIQKCDWRHTGDPRRAYRVPKVITAHRPDDGPAVVISAKGDAEAAFAEIAACVRRLLDAGKVTDPNQVAFLFPTLKSKAVTLMRTALEAEGFKVYAPRAGRFLEVQEAVDMIGLFTHVFSRPYLNRAAGGDYGKFCAWLDAAKERGAKLRAADPELDAYIEERRAEIKQAVSDYKALTDVVTQHGWDLGAPYALSMKIPLRNAPGLSQRAAQAIVSRYFERIAIAREAAGNPFTLEYILRRATALDWNTLDLFYRLCGFQHFTAMLDLAQSGQDEGPAFNLSLLSQYLARFVEEYAAVITAELLKDRLFSTLFYMSFLLSLFRRAESEYENAEDPFPKGRIPFITIHQSKGLEFPVVVLANPAPRTHPPRRADVFVYPFLDRAPGEPLDRMDEFDTMRMFYVALSRAQNLLILGDANYYSGGLFRNLCAANHIPLLATLDPAAVPAAVAHDSDLPQSYSYTADYLEYKKCPRQYMLFRKYGFVPSRSQVQFFGSLVHQTLEDLHNYLIAQKEARP